MDIKSGDNSRTATGRRSDASWRTGGSGERCVRDIGKAIRRIRAG